MEEIYKKKSVKILNCIIKLPYNTNIVDEKFFNSLFQSDFDNTWTNSLKVLCCL